MPSDPRLAQIVAIFAPQIARYRSAVAATLEELRGRLTHHPRIDGEGVEQLRKELGAFAAGRIDAAQLARSAENRPELATDATDRLERASRVLRDMARHVDEMVQLAVGPGEDLTTTVRAHLAGIGRAFAAARLATAPTDDLTLDALPYAEWTAAERRLSPPLLVSIQGSDLHAGGLAEFLDEAQKVVLIVDAPCAVAPLVTLITPGVFVIQTDDIAACEQVAHWPGTAVAAVVPAGCATFVHDPSAGPEMWQRLKLAYVPQGRLDRVGGLSGFQQSETLRQLDALARRPAAGDAAAGDVGAESTDRLAAWLLHQAGLTDS